MYRQEILDILIHNAGKVVSGGFMAGRLGISRNAVWKHLNALKDAGYPIVTYPNRGYMLEDTISYLSKGEIKRNLKTGFLGRELDLMESTDSTNTFLKNLPEADKKDGRVAVSDMQTGGRGRLGRSFYSPENAGCYFSFIVRPRLPLEEINLITVIAAVSTAEAIKKVAGVDVGIKWVNDLMKGGKKVVGILTEGVMSVETMSVEHVVCGIGINANRPDEAVPEELRDIMGYLSDFSGKTVDRNLLISEVLNQFEARYLKMNPSELYDEYLERMILLGSTVSFIHRGESHTGVLEKLNPDFSVNIRTGEGRILTFQSGEISMGSSENNGL